MFLTWQVYSDHLIIPVYPILCLRIHSGMKVVPGRLILNILNSISVGIVNIFHTFQLDIFFLKQLSSNLLRSCNLINICCIFRHLSLKHVVACIFCGPEFQPGFHG